MSAFGLRRAQSHTGVGARARHDAYTVIHPWKGGVRSRFGEIWRFRHVIPYLWGEFIFKRYRKTYLGWLWIPLKPSMDIAMKTLLFGGFLQVGSGDRPYFIYLAFASAGWMLFDHSMKWGTRAVQRGKSISGGMHLPRVLLLMGAAAPAFFEFLLYSAIAIIGTVYYLVARGQNYLAPPQQWPIGFFGLLVLCLFGLGISLFTSPVTAITKEVKYAIGYFTQVLYFITPVLYATSKLPNQYQWIMEYNPITAPIELVKYGFIDTSLPTTPSVISSLIVIPLVIVIGLQFFSRFERAGVARLRL
jgi:lipopolysaccharide transport system permease protein